jgi:hypothetical protein
MGLDSPFKTEAVRNVIDEIHYIILGSHHFDGGDDNNIATVINCNPTCPVNKRWKTEKDAA